VIAYVETWHIDSRGERRRGWDSYSGVDQFLPAGEKSKLMHAQDEHLKSLAQQILDLERSQPRFHTDIPSRELPPQAITEIYAIAADVGMPTHEIENLIEWEINPFTPEERTVLKKYIGITALIVHHKDNINRYGHMQQDIVNEYCCAMANRHRAFLLDTPLAFARMNWQNSAKSYFVSGLTNAFSHYLLENPVKIPSGKYVETLKVERTQQDLNNEMVSELVSLPRFQAYVKLIQETDGRQSVATHKIETHPLPEKPESDIETLVTQSGYDFCKKREDIEAEIRERQNRWGRGGSPPPTRRLRD
jgi:hypothetical protein